MDRTVNQSDALSLNMHRGFTERLLMWFSTNARDFPWRHETDPYRVLVAEKLLQQTTCGHVMKVYATFLEKFPDVKSLAQANVEEIEKTIRRLGFQRQRSKQFKLIASAIMNEYNGEMPQTKGCGNMM